jgi:adenylate cyclase
MSIADPVPLSFESFTLDPAARTLVDATGESIPLRRSEFELLFAFVTNPGRALSRDYLLEAVAGRPSEVFDRSIDVLVGRLRRKIERDARQPRLIVTVPGVGYRFAAKPYPVALPEEVEGSAAVGARQPIIAPPAPRLSFVVLPFTNLSTDPDQEYLTDEITDDLTTDLSRIPGSFVISRHTAFTYKGKPVDAKKIGGELGVRYILEGSVRRTGDQVKVNVQLIAAETGAHVWADRFETRRGRLAEAEAEITGRLTWTITRELYLITGRHVEQDSAAKGDSRDLEVRAQGVWRRPQSPAHFQEAMRLFEQALEFDPKSLVAKNGIAKVLVVSFAAGWSNAAAFQHDQVRAEQLLLEVLEADTNDVEAHLTLGILRRLQGRLDESKIELETTVALDPNNVVGISQIGQTLVFLGQPDEALLYVEKAVRLSPNDPLIYARYSALGQCHLLLGNMVQAIEFLRRARAANSRVYFVHLYLAAALGLRGNLDEARAALAESTKLKPEINSIAALPANRPWEKDPRYSVLRARTMDVGLRAAGMPEQ